MKQKFTVTGMTCSACSAHVDKAGRKLEGVSEVNVNLLGGSMVVENIFGIPGIGRLTVMSISNSDYFLTVAVLFFYSIISLLSVLIVDLSYGIIDPRIRIGGGKTVE